MDDRIKKGDFVHVDFNNAQFTLCHRAEVLSVWDPGEPVWIFRDTQTKQLHYVSENCTITKLDS